jgi:hypothetical protein
MRKKMENNMVKKIRTGEDKEANKFIVFLIISILLLCFILLASVGRDLSIITSFVTGPTASHKPVL